MELVNARRSLIWVTLKALVLVWAWMAVAGGLLLVYGYGSLVAQHEAPPSIALATEPPPSRIYSARGFELGGLERGGRPWTPYAAISPELVRTVVASEDVQFFAHTGVDLRGIGRAARMNVAAGDTTQGGSTLTQQLAKSFVGDQRTYMRKLEELVIARRLEREFSKVEIFEAYINRIYFGAGATGIGAAAEIFFGTSPAELTLSQSALLAAMIPAPSRYNPYQHPDEALERRERVLDRLEETGLATPEEVAAARAEGLGLRALTPSDARVAEVERDVWRRLQEQDPDRDWRREGLAIWTGIDVVRQRRAQRALRDALYALDHRQGYRGPLAQLTDGQGDAFRRAWNALVPRGEVVPGYVVSVDASTVYVWAGEERAVEPEGWQWAVPYQADADNHGQTIGTPSEAFAVGDVVLVRGDAIVQWPLVEGAYGSVDLASESYEALVGGRAPEQSHFNRFTQGCRQPGSTFKPVVYSVALDAGWHPASMLRDTPMRIVLGPYEEWRPRNADGSFDGVITLWQALIWSRNLPALQLYEDVGPRYTIERARRLGIRSTLDPVQSLALGASCVAPEELLEVYATLGSTGFAREPALILGVDDVPWGSALLWSAGASTTQRLSAMWGSEAPERRLRETTAFQLMFLLREVVRMGTGSDLRALGFPVAGKTGTTNAFDAWFAGYSARDAAVVWIGSDQNTRPLGRRETGGHLALPAWGAAMLPDDPEAPILPALPDGMEWVAIDPETGLRAGEGRWGVEMPFRVRQAPSEEGRSRAEHEAFHIDRIGGTF